MVDPEVIRASTFPTFIVILLLAMIFWALAFVRLTFGFRTIVDRESGIRIPPVQIGWVIFAWAFLFVSFWPVIDVLLRDEWVFSDVLVMGVAGLLFFFAAAAIAPDGILRAGHRRLRGHAR